ncbi:Fc.00g106820.m01.CDS01 [Cosmosporella sp. VM-42]
MESQPGKPDGGQADGGQPDGRQPAGDQPALQPHQLSSTGFLRPISSYLKSPSPEDLALCAQLFPSIEKLCVRLDGKIIPDPHPYPGQVPSLRVRSTLPNLPIIFPPASGGLDGGDNGSPSGNNPGHGSAADVTGLLKEGLAKYSLSEFEEAAEIFRKVSTQNEELGTHWLLKNQRLMDLQRQAKAFENDDQSYADFVYEQIYKECMSELQSPWVQEWMKETEGQRRESADRNQHTFADKIEPWERDVVLEDNTDRDMTLILNSLQDQNKTNNIMARIRERYFGEVPPAQYLLHAGWETGEFIGRGCSGIVVEVRHRDDPFHTLAACKLLKFRQNNEEAIKREVMVIQKAAGKHTIEILGHGPIHRWWYAIYMPLAHGDLKSYLDAKRALTVDTERDRHVVGEMRGVLFSCICCLSATLEILHRRGICHGDIKPGNVLLYGNRPVFTDFGLAASTGAVLGTSGDLRYAAPETGNSEAHADAGDVFSLGGVFFDMLETLSAPVLSGDTRFPVVEDTFAASIQRTCFKDQAGRVQELQRLPAYRNFPGLTEALLHIAVTNMLTMPGMRKNAATVSTLIKKVMVEMSFQDGCCTSKEPVQRNLLQETCEEAVREALPKLKEYIRLMPLRGQPIQEDSAADEDSASEYEEYGALFATDLWERRRPRT